MAIAVKLGVVFKVLKPEVYGLFALIDSIFSVAGYQAVITSANDSKHMAKSFHYRDLAIDLRSKMLPSVPVKQEILEKLRHSLGSEYQVFLEHLGTDNEHFHIEPSS